jgi:NAD+ kinase
VCSSDLTPTGSTAYSLAAGGPIIHPQVAAAVLTPICPHTLTYRPLIIPSGSEVRIKLLTGAEEVYLTLDGQRGGVLDPNDVLAVRKAPVELQLVTSPRRSYYDLVKEKLSWAE